MRANEKLRRRPLLSSRSENSSYHFFLRLNAPDDAYACPPEVMVASNAVVAYMVPHHSADGHIKNTTETIGVTLSTLDKGGGWQLGVELKRVRP